MNLKDKLTKLVEDAEIAHFNDLVFQMEQTAANGGLMVTTEQLSDKRIKWLEDEGLRVQFNPGGSITISWR